MSIKLDKNTVLDLQDRKVEKIKIFFYDAWCSGTKVYITEDFEVGDDLEKLNLRTSFAIYVEKKDKDKFNWAIITKTVVADHTWKEKVRYIFSNEKVKDRCGCGSSFSFSKKELKIDMEKLKDLKFNFKSKWK